MPVGGGWTPIAYGFPWFVAAARLFGRILHPTYATPSRKPSPVEANFVWPLSAVVFLVASGVRQEHGAWSRLMVGTRDVLCA